MKRRLVLTGIVIALAVTASVCGGGGSGPATVSIKTLQAAVSNTQAEESTQFTMDVAINAFGKAFTVHGDGVSSGDGKTMEVHLTVPIVGAVDVRMVDDALYLDLSQVPMAASRLPEGKHWIRIDRNEIGAKFGNTFGDFLDQANNGPVRGLEYLQGLSGDVQNVGDDTVAGAHATHYRATIDPSKIDPKLAKLDPAPADVWIDDHDRVVKMHFSLAGGAQSAAQGSAEFTVEITDFGVPVNVEAPAPDQTTDFGQIHEGAGAVSA